MLTVSVPHVPAAGMFSLLDFVYWKPCVIIMHHILVTGKQLCLRITLKSKNTGRFWALMHGNVKYCE